MSRDREYLLDILEAARLAQKYVAPKTKEQFFEDVQCQDAVVRRLEILGEAARRLSERIRMALPQIPWNSVIGMRNIVLHEYDHVDLELVWRTVKSDLTSLIEAIEPFLDHVIETDT